MIRNIELKRKIDKLVQQGFSYGEIAPIVKLKSKQAVAYNFKQYRKFLKKVDKNK